MLPDALNDRDWRIYHDPAMHLIAHARKLCAKEPIGIDLGATVYALDTTMIELSLSLFDWAPFRRAKAVVKMYRLLDLRGPSPTFIQIADGKMHEVNILDFLPIKAGAFYATDRSYLDFGRLSKVHQAGAYIVPRAKRDMDTRRVYSTPTNRSTGLICDQTIALKKSETLNCFEPFAHRKLQSSAASTPIQYTRGADD